MSNRSPIPCWLPPAETPIHMGVHHIRPAHVSKKEQLVPPAAWNRHGSSGLAQDAGPRGGHVVFRAGFAGGDFLNQSDGLKSLREKTSRKIKAASSQQAAMAEPGGFHEDIGKGAANLNTAGGHCIAGAF